MPTTIIISTRVKPDCRVGRMCIFPGMSVVPVSSCDTQRKISRFDAEKPKNQAAFRDAIIFIYSNLRIGMELVVMEITATVMILDRRKCNVPAGTESAEALRQWTKPWRGGRSKERESIERSCGNALRLPTIRRAALCPRRITAARGPSRIDEARRANESIESALRSTIKLTNSEELRAMSPAGMEPLGSDMDKAQRANERERVSQWNLRSMLSLSWPTSWRVVQCPRRESNPHLRFRKPLFFPLNYGDQIRGGRIDGLNAGEQVARRDRNYAAKDAFV